MNITQYKKIALSLVPLLFIVACGSEDNVGRIVIGNGNTMFALNDLQYQDPFVVQVTDVDGNAAANTVVKVQLKSLSFNKGSYRRTGSGWSPVYTVEDCPAEDTNNNGILDTGEDNNNNGKLDPTNSATIAQHPDLTPTLIAGSNQLITDEFGFGYFSLTYPKSESNWSAIEIMVTASFSGTENVATKIENLPALVEDLEDEDISPLGGDGNSPYGIVGDCTDPN